MHIGWGNSHASPLIRIPQNKGGGKRIELRSPDSAANPYLALALCLGAGLDGIRRQMLPLDCTDVPGINLRRQEPVQMEEIPGTLSEALCEMERDSLVKGVLGEHAFRKYMELKKQEWNAYKAQVSAWELEQYLYRY